MPSPRRRSIVARIARAVGGPPISHVVGSTTRANTIVPSALSAPASRIASAGLRGTSPAGSATIVPAASRTRGFGSPSSASDGSPSRPIDVTAIATPYRAATARSALNVVVFPAFFAVPTTTTLRAAAVASAYSASGADVEELEPGKR